MIKVESFSRLVVFCAIILAFAISGKAQDEESKKFGKNDFLVDRLSRIVKDKEKTKSVGRKVTQLDPKYVSSKVSFGRDNGSANIRVYEFAESDSAANFVKTTFLDQIGMSMRTKYTRLTDLGDEAYFTQSLTSRRSSIILRRSGTVVFIDSSSPEIAKRFAKYSIDEATKRERGN